MTRGPGFSPRPSGVQQQRSGNGLYNIRPLDAVADFKNPYVSSGGLVALAANVAQRVLPANRRRSMLIVQNLDATATNVAFVRFGTAPTATVGLQIQGNGGYLLLDYICPYTDVYVVSPFAISVYVEETVWTRD
jgi:hypothetical protein